MTLEVTVSSTKFNAIVGCGRRALPFVLCLVVLPRLAFAQSSPGQGDGGPARRIPIAGSVMAAKRIDHVVPVYRPIARQLSVSGTVKVRAIVSKEGTVEQVELISSPSPLLVKAATDAVKQFRYAPTLLSGEPVEVDTTVEIVFSLDPKQPASDAQPEPSQQMFQVDEAWLKQERDSVAAVDPVMAADIRRYMDQLHMRDTIRQLVEPFLQAGRSQILTALPQSENREKIAQAFYEKFSSAIGSDEFFDLFIPIYAKHFTREQLDAVIAFFDSPAGQIVLKMQKDMMAEGQNIGQEYAQKVLVPRVLSELIREFPELKPRQ